MKYLMDGGRVEFKDEEGLADCMHGLQIWAARVNDVEDIIRLRYNFTTRMSSISLQLATKLQLSMVALHDPPGWQSNSGYPFIHSVEGLFFLSRPLKVTLVDQSGSSLREIILSNVLVVPHLNNWCEIQINGREPACPNGPFAELKEPEEIIHGTSTIFIEDQLLEGVLRRLAREGAACAVCRRPSGVSHGLKKCAACKDPLVKYCSVECQRAHWQNHRPICRREV